MEGISITTSASVGHSQHLSVSKTAATGAASPAGKVLGQHMTEDSTTITPSNDHSKQQTLCNALATVMEVEIQHKAVGKESEIVSALKGQVEQQSNNVASSSSVAKVQLQEIKGVEHIITSACNDHSQHHCVGRTAASIAASPVAEVQGQPMIADNRTTTAPGGYSNPHTITSAATASTSASKNQANVDMEGTAAYASQDNSQYHTVGNTTSPLSRVQGQQTFVASNDHSKLQASDNAGAVATKAASTCASEDSAEQEGLEGVASSSMAKTQLQTNSLKRDYNSISSSTNHAKSRVKIQTRGLNK